MATLYATAAAAEAASFDLIQFQVCIDRHVIEPTVRAAGPGSSHHFSRDDVVRAAVLGRLLSLGFPPRRAAAITIKLFAGPAPPNNGRAWAVIDGENATVVTGHESFRPADAVAVLDLSAIAADVDSKLCTPSGMRRLTATDQAIPPIVGEIAHLLARAHA